MPDQIDTNQANAIQGLAQAPQEDVPQIPQNQAAPMEPTLPAVPTPAPQEMAVDQSTPVNSDIPPAPIMDQFSATGAAQNPIVPQASPKKHTNILVLLLLFIGVVLVAAGAAYYFVVMKKVPVDEQPLVENPEPVAPAETPATPEPATPSAPSEVTEDPLIQEMETGIQSQSMNQIEKDLDSLDYEGIDTEIQQDEF